MSARVSGPFITPKPFSLPSAIDHRDFECRQPCFGPPLRRARDAGDPQDPAGRVHQDRLARSRAARNPPLREQLLELLRAPCETDPVTRSPATELQGKSDGRGIERLNEAS